MKENLSHSVCSICVSCCVILWLLKSKWHYSALKHYVLLLSVFWNVKNLNIFSDSWDLFTTWRELKINMLRVKVWLWGLARNKSCISSRWIDLSFSNRVNKSVERNRQGEELEQEQRRQPARGSDLWSSCDRLVFTLASAWVHLLRLF